MRSAASACASDFERVATALGTPERGRALCAELADRIAEIGERVGRADRKPSIACIEWIDPLMGAGNWMPELVALAGAIPLFGKAGEHSEWLEWEALRDADPDIIVLTACGFDLARTRSEARVLNDLDGFSELRAVREGRLFAADGNAYFNRPGPRLVDSLEILAEIAHPSLFEPGHRGDGWDAIA